MYMVRVIYRMIGKRAEIVDCAAFIFQVFGKHFFIFETGVVAADGNAHGSKVTEAIPRSREVVRPGS